MVNLQGKVVETITLSETVFGEKINKPLLAQYVRVYLANQRRGTASTKSRGEVAGSTRKIYRQKGTGKARHGGIRAPIFVHGGVAWGPKPRDFSLSLPQKMKQAALKSALSGKVKDGEITIIKGMLGISPKTKEAVEVIEKLGFTQKKKSILVVLPEEKTENLSRAIRNIQGIVTLPVHVLNAYVVLTAKNVVFTQEGLETLEKMFDKGAKK